MVFKKDLTPIGRKGRVDTHRGKGATEQRMAPRQQETLTGGNPLARTMNQYPAAPQPQPAPRPPMPVSDGSGLQPSALMPTRPLIG
jgi:hypothetical protein